MRSFALVLVLSGLCGVAHAVTKPTVAQLKAYIAGAKVTPIKASVAHNSQAYHFEQARSTHASSFRQLHFGNAAADAGRTAYIPKFVTKGLASNTAYITAEGRGGSHLVGKVKLPLY
ncbi:MAG: hypothetical protein ABI321_18135 [Polyangia bacterium]